MYTFQRAVLELSQPQLSSAQMKQANSSFMISPRNPGNTQSFVPYSFRTVKWFSMTRGVGYKTKRKRLNATAQWTHK